MHPDNHHYDPRNIPKIDASRIRKILVIQYDPVGDSILNIPMFNNIRKFFPHIRTAYLISELPWSLLEGTENIDEFVAECFAMAKCSNYPSPYAIEVLALMEKYKA